MGFRGMAHSIERSHILFRGSTRSQGEDIENGAFFVIDPVVLDGDLGSQFHPLLVLELFRVIPCGQQTGKGDVLHTAGHNPTAKDKVAGGEAFPRAW